MVTLRAGEFVLGRAAYSCSMAALPPSRFLGLAINPPRRNYTFLPSKSVLCTAGYISDDEHSEKNDSEWLRDGRADDRSHMRDSKQSFKSPGSRSAPFRPSIPGRFSKYSQRGAEPRQISNGANTYSTEASSRHFRDGGRSLLGGSSGSTSEGAYTFRERPKPKPVSSEEERYSENVGREENSRYSLRERSNYGVPPSGNASSAESFRYSLADSGKSILPNESTRQSKTGSVIDGKVYVSRFRKKFEKDIEPPPQYELPFEFQYTYSEVPKVAPIAQRGPQFSPFGPDTMPRPWTGRAPLPKSKKKVRDLDSFDPPPAALKKAKPVQAPGPYLEGQSPRRVLSREDVIGDPLTKEEIDELVEECRKEKRQVNLGRDGLTHNMLDLVHNHWKRRRVLKIKCKGVPTIDMDNVCYHIEDKTGGKIIQRAGGTLHLFRGRNYNTMFRPKIPLMLWKPPVPIYPRLVQKCPEGLTFEMAENLRKRGRRVTPLLKLSRNGVYLNLVKYVKEAFEIDELVKIDCEKMNPSDIKKIGAKLREILGIVLLSFEKDTILMWRGPPKPTEDELEIQKFISRNCVGDSGSEQDDDEEEEEEVIYSQKEETTFTATTNNEELQASGAASDDPDNERTENIADCAEEIVKETSELELEPNRTEITDGDEKFYNKKKKKSSALRKLDALWDRAVNFGMVISLDDSELDPDKIKEIAATRARLRDCRIVRDIRPIEENEDIEAAEKNVVRRREDTMELLPGIQDEKYNRLRRVLGTDIKPPPVGALPVDELARLLASAQ